jgi:hypothetical protein
MNGQPTRTITRGPYWPGDSPPPPAGPPGTGGPPREHGRAWLIAAVVAALVLAAGGAAVAAIAFTRNTPGPGAATQPPTAANRPTPPPPDQYVREIWNAGITAPASWIDTTGQTLVADWRAGRTSAWTDANVLAPGGVAPGHYAVFNQITERYFGVFPPPPPPAAQPVDVAVVNQYLTDLNSQDYQAAWNLGGDNLNGGTGYDTWVAGYSTTADMRWTAQDLGNGVVAVDLTAGQTDGSTRTYTGTYTVSNGVIVSAHMTETS